MTKRFTVPVKYRFSHSKVQLNGIPLTNDELVRILNTNDGAFVENFSLKQENEQLKKDVEYWKQVASQYSNELNVLEHCRKYKTECKDIHWSSDVE